MYIAGGCNLACRHCWIAPIFTPDGKNSPFLKLSLAQKAISEALPLGLHTVKLTGGEPMLHPEFREIVDLLDQAGLNITIETNGTLIDDDLATFLAKKNLAFISVSVDGANAATHDALRGVKGSYAQALGGIESLVKAGLSPQMICSIHQDNVSEVAELTALAEQIGCGSIKFNIVQRVGRGEHFAETKGLPLPQILELDQYVEEEIVPQTNLRILLDVPLAFYSIRRLIHDHGRCLITSILGVLATGELSLCGIGFTIPELIYGHLEKDNLQDVWYTNPKLKTLREQIPAHLEGICGKCIHRDRCLGHCVANNFHNSGNLYAPYYFCDQADQLGLFPASRKLQTE